MKGKQFSGQQPLNVHLGLSSNACKNGALMLRNISTPLLNGYTRAILERLNSFSFHALFLKPQNPWNPYFCSVSWRFCGCFWPPPKPTTRIFSPHHRITAKVRFVNKVGALFVFKKRSWNPYFYSVSRAKIENASFFCSFHARFRSQNRSKNPRPGGKNVFSPKLSDYDKRQKIYWPLRVDPAHKPPPKVHHKMTAPKPRRTNNQQRHKGKKTSTTTQQRSNTNPRWGR